MTANWRSVEIAIITWLSILGPYYIITSRHSQMALAVRFFFKRRSATRVKHRYWIVSNWYFLLPTCDLLRGLIWLWLSLHSQLTRPVYCSGCPASDDVSIQRSTRRPMSVAYVKSQRAEKAPGWKSKSTVLHFHRFHCINKELSNIAN